MPPETRSQIPRGSEEVYRQFVDELGGKVLKIIPEEPLRLSQISALKIGSFARELQPSFPEQTTNNYRKLFTSLRDLPLQTQEDILVSFYTERVTGFENGEAYGKFLARVNNIPWLMPTQEPDEDRIRTLVDEHKRRGGDETGDLLVTRDLNTMFDATGNSRWDEYQNGYEILTAAMWSRSTHELHGAVKSVARKNADRFIRTSTKGLTNREIENTAEWISRRAMSSLSQIEEWIMDNDSTDVFYENPFEPILPLFEMGALPLGKVHGGTFDGTFIVFFPPVEGQRNLL